MGKYNGAVITTAGQNLIAQAIAESKTVMFTTAQASSHVYPSSTDFEALTALTDVEKTVDINYAGVYSDTVVQVSARFDNTNVETAYLINTLGFFAQIGTDTPILFAVCTAVTPDQMPVYDADNPSAFVYNLQATVQNADQVTVDVNPAGTVTVEQINLIVNEIESKINARAPINHAVANTTYGGGNATNYGHVQLSDNYDAVNNNQKAANSVGASAWALQSVKALIGVLNDLNTTVKSTIVGAINELKTTVDSKLNADANAVSATKLLNSRNFRTNLGSTSTAGFDGSADCNPGVTGTLAVANGGTGQTTLALARNAMGLGNTTEALPIANGGTGASTAANARSNLGVPPTSHASTGTSYGAGNATNYGHVKVSDNYTSSAGDASQSVAASSKAVYNCYNTFNSIQSGLLTKGSYCRNSSLSSANKWIKAGRLVIFYIFGVEIAAIADTAREDNTYNILRGLPAPYITPYFSIRCGNGESYRFRVTSSGYLCAYFSGSVQQTDIAAFCGVYVL